MRVGAVVDVMWFYAIAVQTVFANAAPESKARVEHKLTSDGTTLYSARKAFGPMVQVFHLEGQSETVLAGCNDDNDK